MATYIYRKTASPWNHPLVSLSPIFMCHIENSMLDSEPEFKPTTYCRYIDDIFIITDSIDKILKLKQSFEETSILTFTCELGINHHINFLDVHVDATQPNIMCSVYQKPINSGIYLNYKSECLRRHKDATINALIHRIYKISSNWQLFQNHIHILKQAFVNNSYPNLLFDKILNSYLCKPNKHTHPYIIHPPSKPPCSRDPPSPTFTSPPSTPEYIQNPNQLHEPHYKQYDCHTAPPILSTGNHQDMT